MKQLQGKTSRRAFLLAVGTGSVTAAAAVVLRGSESSPDKSARSNTAGQGYQVTEHVRNYYRTAQI